VYFFHILFFINIHLVVKAHNKLGISMKKIVLLLLIFFYCLELNASFIASNNKKINPNLPTHILIAGQPDKLGELFVYSLLLVQKYI